jgi:hypothetical protein
MQRGRRQTTRDQGNLRKRVEKFTRQIAFLPKQLSVTGRPVSRRLLLGAVALPLSLSFGLAIANDGGTGAITPALQSVIKATDQARYLNSPILESLVTLRDELRLLEKNLNELEVPVPEEYRAVFQEYAVTLRASSLDQAAVEAIRQDVKLKNNFFSGRAGFWPVSKRPLINVRVMTFRGDSVAPGYRVTFNPLGNRDGEHPLFPFGSDTNNAARLLAPGNYTMRLYRANDVVLERAVPVGVSKSDDEELRIDISAYDKVR